MAESMSTIRADFDQIALLDSAKWDHNNHYHDFLLQHVPTRCQTALEIGCGTGAFSRLLAGRAEHVLALDLSPQMIRVAVEQSRQFRNIDYEVADVTAREFAAGQFDCIVTIATLHHLPLRETLSRMKDALRVGGVLLALDLFQDEGVSDTLLSALAVPLNIGLKLIRHGRLREPRTVREAWAEHGRHDSYSTLAQVREACAEILPGAEIRRHLLWRYSIKWEKKVDGQVIAQNNS